MKPGEMRTPDLLERAAKALESAHEYRVEPEHIPLAVALRRRAARIRDARPAITGDAFANGQSYALKLVNAPDPGTPPTPETAQEPTP